MKTTTMKTTKRLILITLMLTLITAGMTACKKNEEKEEDKTVIGQVGLVKAISFNIRNRAPEIAWETRAEMLKYFVDEYEPDVMGMQEVTMSEHEWIKYIPQAFDMDKYAYVGESRTDDPAYGLEANLVCYRKDKYTLLDSGTFWLNETGNKGELGWDSKYPRTCTYVLLQHKNTDDIFLFMNTHLDNGGATAREEGFKLVVQKSQELGADKYPLIITGDMNTRESDSGLYGVFVSQENIGDVKYLAPDSDTGSTYRTHTHGYPIDYIFVSENNTKPLKYRILIESVNGEYLSDHYGLYSEIMISNYDQNAQNAQNAQE